MVDIYIDKMFYHNIVNYCCTTTLTTIKNCKIAYRFRARKDSIKKIKDDDEAILAGINRRIIYTIMRKYCIKVIIIVCGVLKL